MWARSASADQVSRANHAKRVSFSPILSGHLHNYMRLIRSSWMINWQVSVWSRVSTEVVVSAPTDVLASMVLLAVAARRVSS